MFINMAANQNHDMNIIGVTTIKARVLALMLNS